ncbi:MAG: hypothetical protein WC757_04915 [Candidatus Paceibacterota bacterium]|jgi:hypothetical protein
MRHIIENIKQRPEHQKRAIRLGASVGITGIIAVAWLGFVVSDFNGADSAALASVQSVSPFSSITESLGGITGTFGEKWSSLMQEAKENFAVRTGETGTTTATTTLSVMATTTSQQ